MDKVAVGARYGRLVVVELVKDRKNPKAKCLCDCGAQTITQRGSLKNGRAQSCGCLKTEKFIQRATTHGLSKTELYSLWSSMKSRCFNPSDPAYKNYGGRGITIDDHWLDFQNFYEDMTPRPHGALIERLENDGPYSKENCIWAGWNEQAINKRTSKRWVIHGVEYRSSREAAESLGVDTSVINRRTNGFTTKGHWYPPHKGYSSYFLYKEKE